MKRTLTYLLLLLSFLAKAQDKDKDLPKGNDAFLEKNYTEAEAEYRISESKNKKKAIASYNLGNAVYKQNQAAEAKYHYAEALKNAKTRKEKHQAYHNIGNTMMKEKDYSGAVEAYKNALRNNPSDDESRYNYAFAKKKLEENPPKKKDDKSKDKDKQQDKKEEKKKDENKDKDKDKQDPNKQDQKDQKDKKGDRPQPQPGGMNKQRLQNLLDAVNNEEKKVQDKVNREKVQANPKKTEKDW